MKSIKPGRGPSMMSGVMCVLVGLFGVGWTVLAGSLFPPMALFGIIFILVAAVNAVYNFKNATSKNRYSSFDIVSGDEEQDPLNARFGGVYGSFGDTRKEQENSGENRFCPYCGKAVSDDFQYCNNCGKKLP